MPCDSRHIRNRRILVSGAHQYCVVDFVKFHSGNYPGARPRLTQFSIRHTVSTNPILLSIHCIQLLPNHKTKSSSFGTFRFYFEYGKNPDRWRCAYDTLAVTKRRNLFAIIFSVPAR